YRGFDEIRVLQHGLLDLVRRNHLAPPPETVGEPSGEEEVTRGIGADDIARAVPAVGPRCGRRGSIAVIAAHHALPIMRTDLQLAARGDALERHDAKVGTRAAAR